MSVAKSYGENQGHGYKFRERENEFDFRQGFKPLPAPDKPKSAARSKTGDAVSALDIWGMFLLLIFAGIIGVGMINASGWMTSIQYDINNVVKATDAVYEEIDKLTVKIEKGTGIGVIEYRAVNELGMIYPTADQVVYAEKEPLPVNDFAQYIKENTYQLW
ncbi:MAG: hypothetical protein LBK57_02215 [Clostridiales Family XIII bacterium]|jgi:hypothetical protein|nr:hypothetical protein [Clostridiales Family XIII bacterium]